MCGERGEEIREEQDLWERGRQTPPPSLRDGRGQDHIEDFGSRYLEANKSPEENHHSRSMANVPSVLRDVFYLLNAADEAGHRNPLGKGLDHSHWI